METLSNAESTLSDRENSSGGKSSSKIIVGVMVFIIFLLLGVLVFLYTKGAFEGITDDKVVVEQDEEIEKTEIPKETDSEREEEIEIVNTEWGLFSLPEYGFSVEIPNYISYYDYPINVSGGEDTEHDVPSYWEVKHANEADPQKYMFSDLYDSLVHNIKISFYPDRVPLEIACTGCIDEQHINVYVFQEDSTQEEVEELYSAEIDKMISGDDCAGGYSSEKKWGRDVLAYDLSCVGGEFEGYVFSGDEYVYLIAYRLLHDPETNSYEMALKVLDSMRFE